jgi:flavin reductase (DIM6/NTAB) family NADH-FMN oxidoreductase RutF
VDKVKLGAVPWVYPVPIVLAGANVDGRPNFCTLGDCGIMGIRPPLVYVSLNEAHLTTRGIVETGVYSVNVPSTDMLAVTDYCGIVSGREVDKTALFEVFYGELEIAPMIRACPVNLECTVAHEFTIEHRHVFVGEVSQAYIDREFAVEREGGWQVARMADLDPIVYALDNRYYRMGESIGQGYREGKAFQATARLEG